MNDLAKLSQELFPAVIDEKGVLFEDPIAIRAKINHLEEIANNLPAEKIQIKTTHRFTTGLYAREVFMPAGLLIFGRLHKQANVTILSLGELTILTEDGVSRVKAPYTVCSKPGTKRIIIVHSDSVLTNVHAVTEREIEKLEKELYTEKFDEIDASGFDVVTFATMEGKTWHQ